MNPTKVQRHLGGLNYPASKREVLKSAKDNGAPKEVINALNGINDRKYKTPAELNQEIGSSGRNSGIAKNEPMDDDMEIDMGEEDEEDNKKTSNIDRRGEVEG